ncbi:glutathione S-transferase family protein [Salinisphaera hydrothermalis]|uniref:glutathione S-transferase family protein n=1 Tax=Salinisphaera hydrothermalis TaxID=563188 RepID=UPI00333E72B7
MTPQLFGLERSVYTRIARLALEEKNVAYSLQEVEIFGPAGVPKEHYERHPFGRIPVLQHGDFVVYETQAISRYINDAFTGPQLEPTGVQARARMNQIIGLLDAYAYRPMVWGVFVERVLTDNDGVSADERLVAKSLKSAARCLYALSALVGSNRFLAGPQISLADLHAFPIVRYFCLVQEGYEVIESHAELLRWYKSMLHRPSVLKTATIYENA